MAEFIPLGGGKTVDSIKRDTVDIKESIQDLKLKLDEAEMISVIEGKGGAGFYDLFRNTYSVDMAATTADISVGNVVFSGEKVLKMLPQYFDDFNNVQLSIYSKESKVMVTEQVDETSLVVNKPLSTGTKLYYKGEPYIVV